MSPIVNQKTRKKRTRLNKTKSRGLIDIKRVKKYFVDKNDIYGWIRQTEGIIHKKRKKNKLIDDTRYRPEYGLERGIGQIPTSIMLPIVLIATITQETTCCNWKVR